MFCTNCGSEVQPGQGFCVNCGEPVNGANAQAGAGYGGAQQMNADSYVNNYNNGYNAGNSYGNNNNYNNGAYNAGGYVNNVYNNGGYNTGVQGPAKKGFPWLAVVMPVLLVAVFGGAYVYGTNQMKQNRVPDAPSGYTTTDTQPEVTPVTGNDQTNNQGNEQENGQGNGAPGFSGFDSPSGSSGNDTTGSNGDDTTTPSSSSSDYAAVDAKGYQEPDLSQYSSTEYEYATAYINSDGYVFAPNGGMNDNTVVRDKTMDAFCDYVDEQMSGSGMTLNRDLFYKVLAADLIDSSLGVAKDNYFRESMIYALSFAVHFDSMQIDFKYVSSYTEAPTRYYYTLSAFGQDDIWMVDYTNKEIYMNKGQTRYQDSGNFAMLSNEALAVWLYLVDEFYGLGN